MPDQSPPNPLFTLFNEIGIIEQLSRAMTEAGAAFRLSTITALAPDFAALTQRLPVQDLTALLPTLTRLRQTMDSLRAGE